MNLTLDTHLHSCSEAALDRGGLLGSAGKEGFGVCVCVCKNGFPSRDSVITVWQYRKEGG